MMATSKRRGVSDMVDAALGLPASTPQPDIAIRSEPAPQPDAASSPAVANVDQVDDDGPRLRASAKATLASGDVVRRTVYIGADDWRAVLRLAMRQGVTASDVTRAALRDYLRRQARRSTA